MMTPLKLTSFIVAGKTTLHLCLGSQQDTNRSISNFILLWSENILYMISIFLNLFRLDLWSNM